MEAGSGVSGETDSVGSGSGMTLKSTGWRHPFAGRPAEPVTTRAPPAGSNPLSQATEPVSGCCGQESRRLVQETQSEMAWVQTGTLRFPWGRTKPPPAIIRLESARVRRVSRLSFSFVAFLFFTIHLFP